ncbi:hypothetical protein HY68_14675, partial [Streptomyces sp. AcH 505]
MSAMVTFAQAQERAEEWVNGEVPGYQHREVRVREFDLGFVVWAEDREGGPVSDGGRQRLVIARDSGEATLWPALPVGEVIRRYEEEYGTRPEPAAPAPPQRIDLNQTSFLLTPPEWLQDAADKLGIPDHRPERAGSPEPAAASGAAGSGAGASGAAASDGPGSSGGAPPIGATPWAGTDTNAASEEGSVPLPATVFAPPLSGSDEDDEPRPPTGADAPTALMSGGSQLPRTAVASSFDPQSLPGAEPNPPGVNPAGANPAGPGPVGPGPAGPGAPRPPAAPGRPVGSSASDIADAATSKATAPPRGS